MEKYKKLLDKFKSYKNGLIIHHWDTDGICSAALLYEKLKEISVDKIDTRIPEIGNYFLSENEIDEISNKGYGFISIVDICFPRENVLRLKEKSNSGIFIFDHHLQNEIKEVNYFNPVNKGKYENRYPSTSWLLTHLLKLQINPLSILGLVGDKERGIMKNKKIYKEISSYLKKNDLSFDQLLRMMKLIDSNYEIKDERGVKDAVFFLIKNKDLPLRILEHKDWCNKANELKGEVEKQLSKKIREENNFLILEINTPYNIISTITRRLAFENKSKKVMVINYGYFDDMDQIYIRGEDVQGIIEIARNQGYSAGGKKDVVGIVIQKNKTADLIEDILNIS